MDKEADPVVVLRQGGSEWSITAIPTRPWVARLGARPNARRQCGVLARVLRISPWAWFLLVGLVGACLVMPVAGANAATDRPEKAANPKGRQAQPGGAASLDQPSVEITFATPKRFAIITESERKRQRLYEVNDSIVDPADPSRTVKIQQIERKRLRLRDSQTQRILWIAEGESVPGFPDRRFTRAASLTGVDYRYVETLAPLDPEARLLSIHGDRAVLEVDIRPPQSIVAVSPRHRNSQSLSGGPSTVQSSSQQPDLAPLERVQVAETAPNTYEVNGAELRDALDHGGRLLAQEWPRIQPLLSIRDGIGLQVKSPVADGILTPRGFQVTNPNLAGRAGIEVGDVILAINGQAVNSFGDLYNLYREAVRNPRLSDVEVRLERQGMPVIKTYRIR